MKKITLPLILIAFCFATGFTCSKNAPQTAATTEAAPIETATAQPAATAPSDAPAVPADSAALQTTTETKTVTK